MLSTFISLVSYTLTKRKTYIIVRILSALIILPAIGYGVVLNGLSGMGSPTGGGAANFPYFITTESILVKKMEVPKGTKLTYEKQFLKEGQQDEIMSEARLMSIELPKGETIDWGGVPAYKIIKFFNSEMRGYSVYADFNQLKDDKKTKFSELWQSCSTDLAVLVKDTGDWTFSLENIVDISSCGVDYQRYFKEDEEQQLFLDHIFNELRKAN